MMRIQKQEAFVTHNKIGNELAEELGDSELVDFAMLADLKA